jgi:hypothetical protein
MMLVALVLALAGFAALAMAMDRHARDLLRRAPSPRDVRLRRCGGAFALAAAYGVMVAERGALIGTVLWFGLLSLAAAAVLLTIARIAARPR